MKNKIRLRPAIDSDLSLIKKIIIEGKINPTRLNWERFIVAENSDNIVVGCGQIKPHRDGSLELASIAVTKEWQHQGIANQIILHLMESYQSESLYLICRSGLENFYLPYGFVTLEVDQMPRYFQRLQKVVGIISTLAKIGEIPIVMGRLIL